MTEVGKNAKWADQKIIMGKELGTFETEKKAGNMAITHEGSELIYQDKDNKWKVAELKEEGIIFGQNALSINDISTITIDRKQLKESKIKSASISFVEGYNANFYDSAPADRFELEWARKLIDKMLEENYQPSDFESNKFNSIYERKN